MQANDDQCVHNSHAVLHNYWHGRHNPCACGRYANAKAQWSDPVTVEDQEAAEQAATLLSIQNS